MPTRPFFFLAPCVLVPFFACGGIVEPAPNPATTSTTTTTTTTPTPTTTTPPTTTPTTTTTTTSNPPPPTACVQTNDRIRIDSYGALGQLGCTSIKSAAFDGVIVEAMTHVIAVDTCGPAADCSPLVQKIVVDGAGLDLSTLPMGGYVHVAIDYYNASSCLQSIAVTSLGTWEGAENPVADPDGILYFAAAEGGTETDTNLLSIDRAPNGCLPNVPSCGSDVPDDYSLVFSVPGSIDKYTLKMGEQKVWAFGGPQPQGFVQQYSLRNLRSFYNGACDSYGDYAWWMVRTSEYGAL